jgi:hypothetical protein
MPTGVAPLIVLFCPEAGGRGQRRPRNRVDQRALAATAPTSMKLLLPLSKQREAEAFLTCREARLLVSLYRPANGNLKDAMNSKVLLRNRETGQYYAGTNGWTGNASLAHDFETVESAVQLAQTQRLPGMEAVLRYDNPGCDLILPVRQEP